jgi:hypothetical protein
MTYSHCSTSQQQVARRLIKLEEVLQVRLSRLGLSSEK